ncbi:MAG: hypothetical protein A3K10_12920 [Bacteroidetes bacterium RIFCSPLOWO2_12_FULL_31_6]|nr:MAG: hypothetical protein A3K10_12920 [Bacteroidetes bacterium RIFCSPLOWO2_12_FULL_31_6]
MNFTSNKLTIITQPDIKVACVKSTSGISGSKEAFDKLESRMSSLKGRKMYGVFYPSKKEYLACVQLDDKNSDSMGFEITLIPGGKYVQEKLKDWSNRIPEIGLTFNKLAKNAVDNGLVIDEEGPCIEFYRSVKELVISLPIK